MPLVIILVAVGILVWSQWSSRQDRIKTAEAVTALVDSVCSGQSPVVPIRWADVAVRDAFQGSVGELCGSDPGNRTVVVVDTSDPADEALEARIGVGDRVFMTLTVQLLPDGTIVVQGWSSG